MSTDTATKLLASATAVIGAVGLIYGLLAAFGVELSSAQQDSISAVLSLVLLVAGIWFHPSIPVGPGGSAQTSAKAPKK